MENVDVKRARSSYPHQQCTEECKKRGEDYTSFINVLKQNFIGCGSIWAINGNWKLRYPICMFQSPKQVLAFKNNLSYVNSCPNSPEHGMAFCMEHCEWMRKNGVPTKLQEYLVYKKEHNSTMLIASQLSSAIDCQGKKCFTLLYSHN